MDKIYIETSGCSLNQSDSEVMAGLLEKAGFKIVDNADDGDLVIINTCTVKGPTENSFWKRLDELKGSKKVIVSGCIAQTEPSKLEGLSLIGPYQINRIVEVVEETLNDNVVSLLVKEKNERLNLPKIRKNKAVEIIPICAGCLGDPCAYCKVKEARGDLMSYDKDAIVSQVMKARAAGVKEIWLTAQDTGCYGKDIGMDLVKLLKNVLLVEGDFKVRVGMMNPNFVLEMLDELIEVFKHDKIFKFLHIPIQSGNNEILKRMRRKYSVEDFTKIVARFRAEIPDIVIATDIICGFPGETKEQFMDSVELVRKITPDVLNRSRFWARPGTEAEKMDGQIHGKETKKRSQFLTEVFSNVSLMRNERWIGWEGPIIIDEKGKDGMIGRNFAYKSVMVDGEYELGETVKVKVVKAKTFNLRAEVR